MATQGKVNLTKRSELNMHSEREPIIPNQTAQPHWLIQKLTLRATQTKRAVF